MLVSVCEFIRKEIVYRLYLVQIIALLRKPIKMAVLFPPRHKASVDMDTESKLVNQNHTFDYMR